MRLSAFAIIAILLGLCHSPYSLGADKCIIRAFKELIAESRKKGLSPARAQRMAELRKLPESSARNDEILQLLIDQELELLPPERAANVRAMVWGRVEGRDLNAIAYTSGTNGPHKGTFYGPSHLHGTDVERVYMRHEVQHAIVREYLRMRGHPDDSIRLLLKSAQVHYFEEIGPMMAEAGYLETLSPETRTRIAAELRADYKIDKTDREVAAAIFDSDLRSPRRHVRAQHRAGRYPLETREPPTLEPPKDSKKGNVVRIGAAAAAVAWMAVSARCLELVGDCGTYPSSAVFNYVCMKTPLIGASVKEEIMTKSAACKK